MFKPVKIPNKTSPLNFCYLLEHFNMNLYDQRSFYICKKKIRKLYYIDPVNTTKHF